MCIRDSVRDDLEPPDAITCVSDQLIVSSDSSIYGRPLGDERSLREVRSLAWPAMHLRPAE